MGGTPQPQREKEGGLPKAVQPAPEKADYFEPYSHFARTLRIWFIAYGVGGPLAFLSNDTILAKLMGAGVLRRALCLFFLGAGVQILMAIVWRTSMWYQYLAQDLPELKATKRYRWSYWASEQYWLEFFPDLGTVGLFAWATCVALNAIC